MKSFKVLEVTVTLQVCIFLWISSAHSIELYYLSTIDFLPCKWKLITMYFTTPLLRFISAKMIVSIFFVRFIYKLSGIASAMKTLIVGLFPLLFLGSELIKCNCVYLVSISQKLCWENMDYIFLFAICWNPVIRLFCNDEHTHKIDKYIYMCTHTDESEFVFSDWVRTAWDNTIIPMECEKLGACVQYVVFKHTLSHTLVSRIGIVVRNELVQQQLHNVFTNELKNTAQLLSANASWITDRKQ